MERNAGITPNFSVAAALHTWALPYVKEPLPHISFPDRSHNEVMARDVWSHEQVYDLTMKLGKIVSDIYPVLGVGKINNTSTSKTKGNEEDGSCTDAY